MSLLLILLSLSHLLPPSSSSLQSTTTTSPYDVLRSHGLPIGLLPRDSIESFAIDAAGQFTLRLRSPCTAKFETLLHYEESVSGTISYGLIASLSGISSQELFLWFPVHQIRVDVPSSGLIYFDVGVIYKQFSLSLFDTPPVCLPIPVLKDGMIREGDHIAKMSEERFAPTLFKHPKSRAAKLRYDMDLGYGDKAVL